MSAYEMKSMAAIHNANTLLRLKSGQPLGEQKRSHKSLSGTTHSDQEFP